MLLMRYYCLLLMLLMPVMVQATDFCKQPLEGEKPVKLLFPDGQMKNQLVPVFVTNVFLNQSQSVELQLWEDFINLKSEHNSRLPFPALMVDHNQSWSVEEEQADGKVVTHTYSGSLLLFDVSAFTIDPIRPFVRITPSLSWTSSDQSCRHLLTKSQGKLNLGNPIGVFIITGLLMGGVILLFFALAARRHGSWCSVVEILCESNGKLSLSKLQMAIWTIAIVGVVSVYSQTLISMPEIPWTLLALMGTAYATRASVKWKDDKDQPLDQTASQPDSEKVIAEGEEAVAPAKKIRPELSQLVCDHQGRLSLPRAQMLMWTVLTVAIFVTKSLLDGQMWNVPIELVTLMGLSQAGYAVPDIRSQSAQQK